jgi:hypothetical protein
MVSRSVARICAVFTFAVGMAAAAPAPVFAQPAEAIAKVTQLNREALAAIDKREFEKAREILKRALDTCEASGLDKHPVAARTHVHMGVVIIEGFKNQELGRKQFAKAIEIEPGITMTKSLSTPELEEAFAEAKATPPVRGLAAEVGADEEEAKQAPPPAESATAPSRPPAEGGARPALSANGLSYHALSEVKQGANIVVTVTVDESLKFHKIVLAYRPQGASEFLGREMEAAGNGNYTAEIPDHATTGASVAYYIEAQDDEGQPVAQRGSEVRPLVISFAAPARASSSRAEAVAENKAIRKRRDDDDEDEGPKYFASLLVGSGVGYVSGMGEVNADTPVSGTVSGALLGHAVPEVGYWIQPDLMLSLQGRVQFVAGPTEVDAGGRTYSPVHAALALFAKATMTTGTGSWRPFFSGGLGGGQIRHVVTFGNLKDCGASHTQTCVDSVVAGPLLAEVGGGVMYRLGKQVSLVLGSNAEVAAPHFTVNVDVNAGVGFDF